MQAARTVTMGVLALSLSMPSALSAQQDWRSLLMKDWVTIEGGKMVLEAYSLETLSLPGYDPIQLQVKTRTEVPSSGVMSRDTFIAVSAMLSTILTQQIFVGDADISAAEFFSYYDSQDLEAPIGNPDVELNVFMTAEGMQVEIVDTATGERTRVTDTWASMFGN